LKHLNQTLLIMVLLTSACNEKPGTNTLIIQDTPQAEYFGSKDAELESDADEASEDKAAGKDKTAGKDNAPAPVVATPLPAEDEEKVPNLSPIEPDIDIRPVVAPKPVPEVMGIIKNGEYNIKGVGSKKCLQAVDKSKAAEAILVQETCSTEYSQRFQFTLVEGKFYQITNVDSLLSLEIKDAIAVPEVRITQNTYTRGTHQQFVVEALANGAFNIKSRLSASYCLDVSFGSVSNGAFIQLWNQCSLPNQQFTILPVP
jgi:Ricin-type beta-trefoil lectin domain-like